MSDKREEPFPIDEIIDEMGPEARRAYDAETAKPHSEDYILLKWGTLKGWKLHKEKSLELMQKYYDLGVSMSVMTQRDTAEQKQLLCDLIRQHDGTIQNDWDGKFYSKEEAIDYIFNYGK